MEIFKTRFLFLTSVADPGSGAFLTLGSWIGFFQIPDLGSRISNPGSQTHIFWELSDKFLGKKFCNSLKIGPNFFLLTSKNKIIYNFVKFVATKKGMTTYFFSPFSFVACFGSEIRDPGWVKIRIRDKLPGSATLFLTMHSLKNFNSAVSLNLLN